MRGNGREAVGDPNGGERRNLVENACPENLTAATDVISLLLGPKQAKRVK
jgi:hypothetical protein